MWKNSADPEVSKEGGAGDALCTGAEISLQSLMKTTVSKLPPCSLWRSTAEQRFTCSPWFTCAPAWRRLWPRGRLHEGPHGNREGAWGIFPLRRRVWQMQLVKTWFQPPFLSPWASKDEVGNIGSEVKPGKKGGVGRSFWSFHWGFLVILHCFHL